MVLSHVVQMKMFLMLVRSQFDSVWRIHRDSIRPDNLPIGNYRPPLFFSGAGRATPGRKKSGPTHWLAHRELTSSQTRHNSLAVAEVCWAF